MVDDDGDSFDDLGEVGDKLDKRVFARHDVERERAQASGIVRVFDSVHVLDLGDNWVLEAFLEQSVL